jgi:hypothetical protein
MPVKNQGKRLLLSQPRDQVVHVTSLGASMGTVGNLRVRTDFGPWSTDNSDWRAEVERRVDRLVADLQDVADRFANQESAVQSQIDLVRANAEATVEHVRETARRSQIRGVRQQSLGLVLAILGTLIQVMARLFG